MAERLPVIYVRGFGGGQSGIDKVVDDPFYGFNEGSSHVRVGAHGQPRFYQFESPLLRLILDHGYELRVRGSQQQQLLDAQPGTLPPNSLWVYRFYDENSGTFGHEPKPYQIEKAAESLAGFLRLVLDKTADASRVYLVAHSMGGLICRSMLQRYVRQPEALVSKLVTIGTPHGGVDPELGGGVGDWIMDKFGPNGSDIFHPRRMREYLLPDGYQEPRDIDPATGKQREWDARTLVGTFPVRRILSIVGTNAKDYDVARGWSTRVMGVQSDGLVAIRNAYVRRSARAYVHRSHSGRYGLVNSEEVYQNLRRFLFGTLRVEIGIGGVDFQGEQERVWQADVRLAIRELPVLMHEQRAEHHCPVDLNAEAKLIPTPTSPVPLIVTWLLPSASKEYARYALHLKVTGLEERRGIFGLRDHLEQMADWEDTLIADVKVRDDGLVEEVRWQWSGDLPGRIAEKEVLDNRLEWQADRTSDGQWNPDVPLPPMGRAVLGEDAHVSLTVTPWD